MKVHQNHLQFLRGSSIYEKINNVKYSSDFKNYIQDKKALVKEQFMQKYSLHIIRQYDALSKFLMLDLDGYENTIDIFEQQITHFGDQRDIYFRPFNILKRVFDDGDEILVNDNLSYMDINDDEFLTFSILDEKDFTNWVDAVYGWFDTLFQNMEEGIVIKPRQAFIQRLPPALKVRNNDYLTMIYGLDFQSNFDSYFAKRNIAKKVECSINDWMLNREILNVRYSDIHEENYLLKNLVLDRIMGERIEARVDKRL